MNVESNLNTINIEETEVNPEHFLRTKMDIIHADAVVKSEPFNIEGNIPGLNIKESNLSDHPVPEHFMITEMTETSETDLNLQAYAEINGSEGPPSSDHLEADTFLDMNEPSPVKSEPKLEIENVEYKNDSEDDFEANKGRDIYFPFNYSIVTNYFYQG